MKIARIALFSTLILLGAACASQNASRTPLETGKTCPPDHSLIAFIASLRVGETYLRMNADELERITGFKRIGMMTTVERQPATGVCNCCTSIAYDAEDRVRSVVIIRTIESRQAAKALVNDLVRASGLPSATTEIPGDDLALYRWKIPASSGRQLGLDVSFTPVDSGLVRVNFVLGVL